MAILLNVGRLVSTTDMKLAKKLQQTVKIAEITGGKTPEALRQSGRGISFMFNGNYYELEAA